MTSTEGPVSLRLIAVPVSRLRVSTILISLGDAASKSVARWRARDCCKQRGGTSQTSCLLHGVIRLRPWFRPRPLRSITIRSQPQKWTHTLSNFIPGPMRQLHAVPNRAPSTGNLTLPNAVPRSWYESSSDDALRQRPCSQLLWPYPQCQLPLTTCCQSLWQRQDTEG